MTECRDGKHVILPPSSICTCGAVSVAYQEFCSPNFELRYIVVEYSQPYIKSLSVSGDPLA